MSYGVNHDEAREKLEGLSLDALDATERDAVLTHVASCADCRDHLTALRDTAAQLAYLVTPLPLTPEQRGRIRGRLLERAIADRNPTIDFSVRTPVASSGEGIPIDIAAFEEPPRPTRASNWAALAASVIAVLSLGMLVRTRNERDDLRDALREATIGRNTAAATLETARGAILDRDRLIANLTGPDVAVVNLAASGEQAPSAHMYWDRSADAWTFVAHHLPAPAAGRTYQLWLVTPSAKISAGTFSPGADGEAMVRAKYALDRNALAAVAVTDEPEHGSAQPTTVPVISGTTTR
jgi:hypothetical protein